MKTVKFLNDLGTWPTLSGSISSGDTTLVVSSATGWPSDGDFTILIEDEIMLVTAVSGTTWTVSRGQEGRTAASHASGKPIYGILTKGMMDRLVTTSQNSTLVSQGRQINFVDGPAAAWTVTDSSGVADVTGTVGNEAPWTHPGTGWSWANQGSATWTSTNPFANYLYAPPVSGDQFRVVYKSISSAPYTITWRMLCNNVNANSPSQGAVLYDTSGGKLITFVIARGKIEIYQMNSTSSFSSAPLSVTSTSEPKWMKIQDDSTNRTYHISHDGYNWLQLYSEGHTTWITPNAAGIFSNSNGATYGVGTILQSYAVTYP